MHWHSDDFHEYVSLLESVRCRVARRLAGIVCVILHWDDTFVNSPRYQFMWTVIAG